MSADTTNNQAQTTETPKANDKEHNFALIRKQLEQEKMARLQAEERAALLEAQSQQAKSVRYDDDDRDDEPYVDSRKLEKKFAKFEQEMDKKIDQKAEQKAAMMIEQERKNAYLAHNSDFNEVMDAEIVQRFADKHPALAKSILNMPDGFERQKLVYENIKALGVNKKDAPQQSIQQKIDANRKSPFYQPSSVGTSPYASEANYSPAGQKDAYTKMKELQKNLRLG